MNRREALAKAAITTPDVGTGLLDPERGRTFVRTIKDKGVLLNKMRQEIRGAPSGEIDKIATGSRLIRRATENSDDGYRAGATWDTAAYQTTKIRLPWEVTEDVFQENLEGERLEATLTDEMTQQFGLDLEDLAINGDTADVSADAPFLTIDDGILKLIATENRAGRRINGAAINAGAIVKEHFFTARRAMPDKFFNQGNLVWLGAPSLKTDWWEGLTNRAGAQGDSLLGGANGVVNGPLGIPFVEVPAMPTSQLLLANPRNFVQVVSWQVRKRKVTGETDAELAAKDKRFYVFFVKQDIIIEEPDAVVQVYGLT